MARPRTIDPDGEVVRMNIRIDQITATAIQNEAKERGITTSAVIRQRLKKGNK
jgi:hypothetical protein